MGLDEETTRLVVLEHCSYDRPKEQLIRRLLVSEGAKLNHLLNWLTLGDRPANQLLREIGHLGGDKVGSELLKSL